MKSYLFLMTALSDDLTTRRTWERYVSAHDRAEGFGIIAIQMANSGIKVLEIRAIETPATPFAGG